MHRFSAAVAATTPGSSAPTMKPWNRSPCRPERPVGRPRGTPSRFGSFNNCLPLFVALCCPRCITNAVKDAVKTPSHLLGRCLLGEVGKAPHVGNAAAQTRVVSMTAIRLGSWESARAFKGIICDDIFEFESHMRPRCLRCQPSEPAQHPPSREQEETVSVNGDIRAGGICACPDRHRCF